MTTTVLIAHFVYVMQAVECKRIIIRDNWDLLETVSGKNPHHFMTRTSHLASAALWCSERINPLGSLLLNISIASTTNIATVYG